MAWLDLSRSLDPVEAVARGIRLEWLVVITPASLDEGLSIAGSLLAGRSVDMLVLDLPGGRLAKTDRPARSPTGSIGLPRSRVARRPCS